MNRAQEGILMKKPSQQSGLLGWSGRKKKRLEIQAFFIFDGSATG